MVWLYPVGLVIGAFWSMFVIARMVFEYFWRRKNVFHYNTHSLPESAHSIGESNFIMAKNVKLHYVASGNSDKPLMLFLHGFPEFWYSWRHQIAHFKSSFRVVALTLRGYAESEKPPSVFDYRMTELVADVKYVIEGLGYKRCVLVAHDWGGAIAWLFASWHPDMVQKLIVLNAPHPGTFRDHMTSSLKQFLMSWYMFFFQLPYLPELMIRSCDFEAFDHMYKVKTGKSGDVIEGGFTKDDVEAYKYAFSQPGALTAAINYYRASQRYPPEDELVTKRISCPSLVIWGRDDLALSADLAELPKEYVDDLTVKYIDDATHWVQQDAPQQVNEYIGEFVTDIKEK